MYMKIWINFLWSFWSHEKIHVFLEELVSQDSSHTFEIYISEDMPFQHEKCHIHIIDNFMTFHRIFWWKKYDLYLNLWDTFHFWIPKNTFFFIPTLDMLAYPELNQTKFFQKYLWITSLKYMLKKSAKIYVLSETNKQELNEKLNISEEKIFVLNAFFWPFQTHGDSQTNIKNKHGLQNEYIIFDAEIGKWDNSRRLLLSLAEMIKTHPLSLIILWNQAGNNLGFRENILQLWLEKYVVFVGEPEEKERKNYYSQTLWVFYPVLYNHFPFSLGYATYYNSPIFASQHTEIKNVFWDSIHYFSPMTQESMYQSIVSSFENKKQYDYSNIIHTFSMRNFVNSLVKDYKNYIIN